MNVAGHVDKIRRLDDLRKRLDGRFRRSPAFITCLPVPTPPISSRC